MKKINIIKIIFIIIAVGILLMGGLNTINIKIKDILYKNKVQYNFPINERGVVNNEYFGINNNGKYPEETTKGINEAIKYASKRNIEYIQFQKGEYCIKGSGENGQIGIETVSNMKIDFNGSKVIQNVNANSSYTTIAIYNSNNVEIINVNIIGDKNEHDYGQKNNSHDDGMGIRIQHSNNIKIKNVEIKNMTGDGIIIAYGSENVEIHNSIIYNCRRQGISIVDGKKIYIYNNEISDISGTGPQALIDIETFQENKNVEEVEIYNNKLYKSNSNTAILLYSGGRKIKIYDNEITGSIHIYNAIDTVEIIKNNLKSGFIRTYDIDKFEISNITVKENLLYKYDIDINKANYVTIEGNIEQK